MKKLTIILFLIPILSFGQWVEKDYFFVSARVDPKNLLFGSEDVNPPAFNGRFTLGYRNEGFQAQSTYETFKAIEFQSVQVAAGPAFNIGMPLQFVALISIGVIKREVNWIPQQYHISFSTEGNIEYHIINRFAVKGILEGKYRGELEKIIASGYLEIQYKF